MDGAQWNMEIDLYGQSWNMEIDLYGQTLMFVRHDILLHGSGS